MVLIHVNQVGDDIYSFSFGLPLLSSFQSTCNIVLFFCTLIGNYTTHERPEIVL